MNAMEMEAKNTCLRGAIALSNTGITFLEKNKIAEAIETIIDSTVVLRQGLSAPMISYLGVPAFISNAEIRASRCESNASFHRIPVRGVSFADPTVLSFLCEQSGTFYPIRITDSDALWEADPGLLSAILFYNLGVAFMCSSTVRDARENNQAEHRSQAIHFFKVAICLIHGAGKKVVKLAILHSLLPTVVCADKGGVLYERLLLDITAEFDELVRAVKEIGGLLEGSTGNKVAAAA